MCMNLRGALMDTNAGLTRRLVTVFVLISGAYALPPLLVAAVTGVLRWLSAGYLSATLRDGHVFCADLRFRDCWRGECRIG